MVYTRSMNNRGEYRARAEYCRQLAAKALTPLEKEGWLQQATDWRMLAQLSDRECRTAAEMNDPAHRKQMEVVDKIWETLAAQLSKGINKA